MTKRYMLYVLSREFFQSLLVSYVLLSILEAIWPGVASSFFNMNRLLLSVLACGITMALAEKKGFRYKLMLTKTAFTQR